MNFSFKSTFALFSYFKNIAIFIVPHLLYIDTIAR